MYTDEAKTKAWSKMDDAVKAYGVGLVERWNREIDGFLTFVSSSSHHSFYNFREFTMFSRT